LKISYLTEPFQFHRYRSTFYKRINFELSFRTYLSCKKFELKLQNKIFLPNQFREKKSLSEEFTYWRINLMLVRSFFQISEIVNKRKNLKSRKKVQVGFPRYSRTADPEFWSILSMWISEFADKKSNNDGHLYLFPLFTSGDNPTKHFSSKTHNFSVYFAMKIHFLSEITIVYVDILTWLSITGSRQISYVVA